MKARRPGAGGTGLVALIPTALVVLVLVLPSLPLAADPISEDASLDETLETVDATTAPWSAVARVNNSTGAFCAGVLVAPDRVITAAHCVYNPRSERFLPADAIHVLLGFSRGDYLFHARATAYRTGDGYAPGGATLPADFAVITLDTPAPAAIAPLPLGGPPAAGTLLTAAGYGRQRAFVPTVIRTCAVLAPAAGPVLAVGCAAPHGYSGGPLIEPGPHPAVAGIIVAGTTVGRPPVTYAVPAASIARAVAGSP